MSTPEAAWPEELIEALAEYQYVRGAPFGAKWERAQFKDAWRQRATDDLNFCVAWRDPKGEPAVVRAALEDNPVFLAMRERAQGAEAERDALRAALEQIAAWSALRGTLGYEGPQAVARAALAGVDHGE